MVSSSISTARIPGLVRRGNKSRAPRKRSSYSKVCLPRPIHLLAPKGIQSSWRPVCLLGINARIFSVYSRRYKRLIPGPHIGNNHTGRRSPLHGSCRMYPNAVTLSGYQHFLLLRSILCGTLCGNFPPKFAKGWKICQDMEIDNCCISTTCRNMRRL